MEATILVSSTSFYLISQVFGKTMFIQSISDTSRKILNKIETDISYNNDLDNMYIDTDIIATINTLQSLVTEINNYNSSETLNMALNNLNTVIIEIHDLLKTIEEKIEIHNNKYFNFIIRLNVYNEISFIKRKNNILDKRLNLLIKILQINKYKNYVNLSNDRRIILKKKF